MNAFFPPLLYLLLSQTASPAELTPPANPFPVQPAPIAVAPARPSVEPAGAPPVTPRSVGADGASRKTQGDPASVPPAAPTPPAVNQFDPFPRDRNVVGTQAVAPAAPAPKDRGRGDARVSDAPDKTDDASLAGRLLREPLEQADATAFRAEKISLYESLRHASDTSLQRRVVDAYWRLVAAIVQYSWAEEESVVLSQLKVPADAYERALVAAAQAAARSRQQDAQVAVMTAQHQLLDGSPASSPAALPWPSDVPFVGAYRTNYEALFAERVAPVRLQRIQRLLPVSLQVVNSRSQAVATAAEAVRQVSRAYAENQVPLRVLLETADDWRQQREAFLADVLRYNDEIAEYALTVVGPTADPATVVSTLIKWERTASASPGVDRDVRTTSGATPAPPVGASSAPRAEIRPPNELPRESTSPEPKMLPQGRSVLRSIRVAH